MPQRDPWIAIARAGHQGLALRLTAEDCVALCSDGELLRAAEERLPERFQGIPWDRMPVIATYLPDDSPPEDSSHGR